MEASLLFVDMRMVWILSNRLFFSKAFAKILVVGGFCFFSDASSISMHISAVQVFRPLAETFHGWYGWWR